MRYNLKGPQLGALLLYPHFPSLNSLSFNACARASRVRVISPSSTLSVAERSECLRKGAERRPEGPSNGYRPAYLPPTLSQPSDLSQGAR